MGLFRSLKGRIPAKPAPIILMYHRVATPLQDPWGLAVSPANFESQLLMLKRHYQVLPLSEFARFRREGRLPPNAVAITFDDGYACNALVAAPLLDLHGLPATFFLATGMIGKRHEFWSDELERVVFDSSSRGSARITIGGESLDVDLGSATDAPEVARAWIEFDPPRTLAQAIRKRLNGVVGRDRPRRSPRQDAYLRLWAALKPLSAEEQMTAIARLASEVGSTAPPRESHRPMTRDEAGAMASRGISEIGGHTVTHPSLPAWDRARQKREIFDSIDACEEISGRRVTTFAYPYGDHSDTTLAVMAERGIDAACATISLPVRSGAHPLALPRMQVLDWPGDKLLVMMNAHARKH
jgi:peptidoglycan/xylan/chitin deacetylase (PgdA/CDA1 family)